MMPDLHKKSISYQEFVEKYTGKDINSINDYFLFKRNECIKNENKNGSKYQELAKKYNLSERTIGEIIRCS